MPLEQSHNQPLQEALETLIACYNARDFQGAEQQALSLTERYPNHPVPWKVLGGVLKITGRAAAALEAMQQSVKLDTNDAKAHNNLGVTLKELGRLAEAEASYCRALEINPGLASAHNNLGNLFILQARFLEAQACFAEAIRLNSDFANAHYNLGLAHQNCGQRTEAEHCYREALRLAPNYAEAYINLGAILLDRGQLVSAAEMYREAIRLRPDVARAHNNLGNALKDLGDLPGAMASYREALRLNSADTKAGSNLLFSLNYSELMSPADALLEAKRYGDGVSSTAVPKFTAWPVNSDVKKLRVGFVSGDLRNHPVGYFIEGLIRYLDPAQFELCAFTTHHKVDELTERLKPFFSAWVPIFGLPDADAAKAIYERGVDVLIDLSGHTGHNRLPVFAYKPAPVQATWLGYFATTGLPEMDFFIGDPIMAPEREAGHFTERLCRLAETWLCLAPPDDAEPIMALPALSNGCITFGCFGNLAKMNDAVVALWSRVLLAVPGAKLFLKAKQLAEGKMMDAVRARFARHGIGLDRLLLEGPTSRSDYFQAHNRVDMVLDTFPYPGGTTSTDALWMGVPVLTLKGDRFLSHLGESIATNAGQHTWVAQDQDDYVNKAVAFANDIKALSALRARLRAQVLQSPLMQPERFARHFGEALWAMWAQRPHP